MKSVNRAAFGRHLRSRCSRKWRALPPSAAAAYCHCVQRWKRRQAPDGGRAGWERSGPRPFIPGKTPRPVTKRLCGMLFPPVLMLITERSFATQCRPRFPQWSGDIECLQMSVPWSMVKARLAVSRSEKVPAACWHQYEQLLVKILTREVLLFPKKHFVWAVRVCVCGVMERDPHHLSFCRIWLCLHSDCCSSLRQTFCNTLQHWRGSSVIEHACVQRSFFFF